MSKKSAGTRRQPTTLQIDLRKLMRATAQLEADRRRAAHAYKVQRELAEVEQFEAILAAKRAERIVESNVPVPATEDSESLRGLWSSYWTAKPNEDFGMIPARRNRETARPARRKA